MNRTLSIPEWHKMAKEGIAPPVRIQLNGYSMNPLIRGFCDFVTVIPPGEQLQTGDIVLFYEPDTERYVMHRVWEQKDGLILTWGDNCPKPDGWMPLEAIWGKASLIERGGKKILPDPDKGAKWARFWHQAGKIYRLCRRIKQGFIRRISKIVRGSSGED